MHRNKHVFLSGCLALLLSFVIPKLGEADVVENGTFDNATTGWTGTYSTQVGDGSFPFLDTESYYWAGNTGFNAITQTYDLTATEVVELTNTGLNYEMSADLFGFSTQGDKATFTVEFFDTIGATGTSLGTEILDGINPGAWGSNLTAGSGDNFFATTGSFDVSTKSVLITLSSTRASGSSNDGYADNVSFSVVSVPEPSSSAFLIGIALAVTCKRHRR